MNCVPALCVPTERLVSTEWKSSKLSGGNSSAERRSKHTRAKYVHCFLFIFLFIFFNFAISPSCVRAYSDSLKTKHVISHALRLRLVLFDESNRKLRKRLSSLPPPLLSLIFFFSWSERKQQGKLSDKIQKLEQQTELLGHWGWVFVRRVKCFAL